MQNKTVTAIIPSFNSAKYIKEAIDSVLNQSYKDIEIIVIDDGSTDNTKSELKNYIIENKIIYIEQKKSGPAAARNNGILHATGKYIAFLDADDIWLPKKIEKQLHIIKEKGEKTIVHTSRFIMPENPNMEITNIPSGHVTKELLNRNFITNSSVMAIREALIKNPLDESPKLAAVEDYDLWLRLSLNYEFEYIPEKLVGYRVHKDQISKRGQAYKKLCDLYKKIILDPLFLPYIFLVLKKYLYLKIKATQERILNNPPMIHFK